MNFFLFLILISTALPIDSSYSQDFQKQTASGPQKKILVLTTSGGGGHSAAAQAVRESLEDRYEVNVLDIIGHLPLLEGGAKIFDHCFANQSWSYMKILLFLQPKAVEDLAVLYCKKKIISLITEKSPDLIVSVLPTANYVYLEEAKQLGIPLVVIPTDFTPTAFFHKIKNLRASQTLTIILPFEEPKTSSYLRMRDLNNLVYDGYPVRRIFNDIGNKLKSGDSNLKEDLKNYALTRFQIDTARGDKAVFLGMGAKGFAGKLIQRYAEIFLAYGHMALSSQEAHLHVLIASGSNKGLLDKLTELRNRHLRTGNSSRIHLHPLEWMNGDQMAQTLAISDVVMTKPGGSTVA
ncbi:MAG: hypothetical protein ABIQ95_13370, partial [Bdellovibrionia bacterium]